MKTIGIFIALAFSAAIVNAQGVIELKEAKVVAAPLYEMSGNENTFTVNIKEKFAGEFELNPVAFLERNFNIKDFMAYTKEKDYNSYQVNFISRKGKMEAYYNKDGELVSSRFKFKDVLLPYHLIQQTYLDNQGWSLVKNSFEGKQKAGKLLSSHYLLTMENGKDKKRIKVDAVSGMRTGIAHLD